MLPRYFLPVFADRRTSALVVLITLFFCLPQSLCGQPQMLFAVSMGGASDEMGVSIAVDDSGNQYITGSFQGVADFDPGPGVFNMTPNSGGQRDIFLVKLDAAQNFIWAKQWGSPGGEFVYSVQLDTAGNVCVCGTFAATVDFDPGPGVLNLNASGLYDGFLIKLDNGGNLLWVKQFTGLAEEWLTAMRMDANGDILLAGFIDGPSDLDPGPGTFSVSTAASDVFVARFDFNGNFIWARMMGGSNDDVCNALAMDNNGDLVVTGYFRGISDYDPGPGVFNLTSASNLYDTFITKLDANGNFSWAKSIPAGTFSNIGYCVFTDSANNVYTSGEFGGTCDFDPGPASYNVTAPAGNGVDLFLLKMNAAGNFLWANAVGGGGTERAYSIGIDTLQNVFISGTQGSDTVDYDPTSGSYLVGTQSFGLHSFVAKYSPAGAIICAFLIKETTATKWAMSQQLLVIGETAYLTGGYRSTVDFNACMPTYSLNNAGGYDVFSTAHNFHSCSCSMQIVSSFTNAQCNGHCDGTATVSVQGGGLPYAYSWLPSGGNGPTATGLCPGSYTCIVTDAYEQVTAVTFLINEPAPLVASLSGTDVVCNGACNGSASLAPSGGTPPYVFSWSNSQSTAAITGLCPGTYSVTVTDNNACVDTQTISIAQPPAIIAAVSATPTPCNASMGAVSATASGGTGALEYTWQPAGDTTASISNLSAGIYSVTITDQNGCTVTLSDTVNSLGAPVINTTGTTDILCNGDSTGSASITATGNGPLTYQWSPYGGNGASAAALAAGNYVVTVTDSAGCTQTQTITILEPVVISTTIAAVDDACTTSSGSISLSPSGGVGAYTYVWSNSQTTQGISGLSGGTYSVTITDTNGCRFDTAATIVSTVAPVLSIASVSNVACYGDSTASATIAASAGVGPYTYAWQPFGGNSATASGISAGLYTVAVSSSDGCTSTITVSITEPPAISMNCGAFDESCNYQDGIAYVQAAGGAGGFTYVWSNSAATDTLFGLSAGNYSVTITDQNGCIETCAVLVSSTATAAANAGSDVTIEEGEPTMLSGSGGAVYSWQPADQVSCSNCASTIATPTVTTTFVLTVTDSAGCTDVDTVVVTVEIPCDDIFVPNAFSPNGDGQNDVLFVRGSCIASFTFSVFNRWGELVFKCSDQTIGWDGTWRGEACENAVFTYTLTGALTDGNLFERRGNVSVVR
jgi:gliding motility-associated-like protein